MKTAVFYGRYSSVTVPVCVYIHWVADNSRLTKCINVSFCFVQVYKLKKLLQKGLTYSYKYDII